eukprot:TRINITY_DN1254_c0_g1_i4.p1 TRINITY_DN1254_c0_g1~~TRINITY_DN1254_c0_g1_i4.p1  ORF type:complete len:981 (+),score=112.61 TRINITY_DN1254_c0_g1_i4:2532-5474(+)
MICGDLNARTGSSQSKNEEMMNFEPHIGFYDEDLEESCLRHSKDNTINNFGKSLLDLCFMFDLDIMNGYCKGDKEGEYTFVSPQGCSVIDYFLVPDFFSQNCNMVVGDCLESWHLPIEMTWQNGMAKHTQNQEAVVEEKIVWSTENADFFQNEQNSNDFRKNLDEAYNILKVDVNRCVDIFVQGMYSAAACMVRMVGKRKKGQDEWFDYECEQKKKDVKKLLKCFQRVKAKDKKEELKEQYVRERSVYVKMKRQKRKEFEEAKIRKLKDSISNSKLFWSTIRTLNRKVTIYSEITLKQWFEHFRNIFSSSDAMIENESNDLEAGDLEEPLFNDPISRGEIVDSIQNLKSGKSPGPDKILGEMLKHSSPLVVDFLVVLFNKLFDEGIFPLDWAKSIIIPLHKKGDINNPDNYRGVALTSVLGKVYTNILKRRLTKWAEREEKIIEEQAGFRSGYSTIDHIFTLYSLVQKYLLRNTKLYVAFVDFRKAFDSVNRNLLWDILRKEGVNGKAYMALRSIYESVLACVRDRCVYSDMFECPRGVKQGCLLSPLLFSFFINELAMEVAKRGRHGIQLIPGAVEVFLLLFADDVILLSDTVIGLQNQLNALKEEADRLDLSVNLDKTNVMVFRKGGHLSRYEKWFYGNNEVSVTNSYTYLGLLFTTKLSLQSTWVESCRKGKKGTIEIIKSLRKLNCIDFSVFWKLFDSQIVPILTYGAEVWGLCNNSGMEKVHTYAIKRFLSVPLHSSNKMLYGETGRYPLYVNTWVKCIKYWLRLTQLPVTRLCRQAYEMMLNQLESGKQNWAYTVKNVLTTHGFGIVWMCQGVGYQQAFMLEFKDRLIASYKQDWHAHLEESNKYSWFFSFKNVFQTERYIKVVNNKWHRLSLARFRLRALGLNANKRWYSADTSSRSPCPMCGALIEDEIHFLFLCKYYDDMRKSCVVFNENISKERDITSVLSTNDEKILRSLARFIALAWDSRRKKTTIDI